MLYRDGVPIAARMAGEVQWLEKRDAPSARPAEEALIGLQAPPAGVRFRPECASARS